MNADKVAAKAALIAELRMHKGRHNAISSRELADVLYRQGISLCSRGVRELLSELEKQEDFPLLLGACGGDGYFVIDQAADVICRVDRWMSTQERLGLLIMAYSRRARKEGIDIEAMRKAKAAKAGKEAA